MTAPERRRPLPALALIGALCLVTAVVWFRVLHRVEGKTTTGAAPPTCTSTPAAPAAARPTVVPPPRRVSVIVLNSTQRSGLATATQKQLLERGFTVSKVADDAPSYGGHGPLRTVGEIRYGPAALAGATLVSFYFPGARLVETRSTSTIVTVALGAKYRAVPDDKSARRALRTAGVRVSRTAATPSATPTPATPAC